MIKNNIRIILLFAFSFIFLLCNSNFVEAAKYTKKDILVETKIKKVLQQQKVNGIVLINGKRNKPKIIRNTCCEKDSLQVVKADKYFPIASLQKVMTGFLTYKLMQSNNMTFSTKVNKYFPNLNLPNNLTIGKLMCHQSRIFDKSIVPKRELLTENERINYFIHNYGIKKQLGWEYASTNYSFLAYLIKIKSGKTYNEYMKKQILQPFGIKKIKPFNEISNSEEIIFPVTEYNNKFELVKRSLNTLPLILSPFCIEVPQFLGSKSVIEFSKYNLYRSLSQLYGAGDYLSTPLEYWKLINKIFNCSNNNSYVRSIHTEALKYKASQYCGGVYFRKGLIQAAGAVGTYNCSGFIINKKKNKTLIFFTNNKRYSNLKKLQHTLMKIYFK